MSNRAANRLSGIVAAILVALCAHEAHFDPWLAFLASAAVITAIQTE